MSWIPRLATGSKAKYLLIVEAIAEDVSAGVLKPGDGLPPQRKIAKALDVNLTTVTRALNEARRVGLVQTRVGAGTIISANTSGASARWKLSDQPALDMNMNIPPQPSRFYLPKLLSKTVGEILGAKNGGHFLNYQDGQGNIVDRQVAALWLRPRLNTNDTERLVISCGGQNALSAIFDVLLSAGDSICAASLTYPGLKSLAMHRNIAVHSIAMDEHGMIPDALERVCKAHSPKAIYLVPSIDNPTTITIPTERREEIVKLTYRYGLKIIEDDPYSALLEKAPPAFAYFAPDITWHIATLSKCLTPALRIAYIVCPSDALATTLTGALRTTSLMVSPLMAGVVTRWIAQGTINEVIDSIRQENVARQAMAKEILVGVRYQAQMEGHHLWLSLPSPWKAIDFSTLAGRERLSVVPSYAFATSHDAPESVRISLGVARDMDTLRQSLLLLATLLKQSPLTTRTVI